MVFVLICLACVVAIGVMLMLAALGDRVARLEARVIWLEVEAGKHRDSVTLLRPPEVER